MTSCFKYISSILGKWAFNVLSIFFNILNGQAELVWKEKSSQMFKNCSVWCKGPDCKSCRLFSMLGFSPADPGLEGVLWGKSSAVDASQRVQVDAFQTLKGTMILRQLKLQKRRLKGFCILQEACLFRLFTVDFFFFISGLFKPKIQICKIFVNILIKHF